MTYEADIFSLVSDECNGRNGGEPHAMTWARGGYRQVPTLCGRCQRLISALERGSTNVDDAMGERGADAISEWHASSYVGDDDRALAKAVLIAALAPQEREADK